jgi:exodeoxyribonuclease VII large subunit
MVRSLFDPAKAAGAEPAAPPTESQRLTVSQAVNLIKTTLETKMPSPLKIVGEVSNFKRNNHWYFSLKDADAVLHCVAWATATRKFAFAPNDGDQIVATGHISHFGPQGRTQLYVSDVQAVGAGALEMRFRALCEELRGLGYFDEARKKTLPIFPRRVAVITSATGAAIQDVMKTAAHRCKAIGLLLVDVRVQGDGAAEEVARAIRWVDRNRQRFAVDAILVTRGGGSIEDLWAFNERIVADAAFKCSLPLVAAIGHESDTTIIELVADVRASTPTQAAMRVIPSSKELCAQIDHLTHRIGSMLRRLMERERQGIRRLGGDLRRIMRAHVIDHKSKIERMRSRLDQLQPRSLIIRKRTELANVQSVLARCVQRHIHRLRERLAANERHLAAIDPHGVIRRGYSLTLFADGSVVRSVNQVKGGEHLVTRVKDGSIDSIATGTPSAQPNRPRKDRSKPASAADQLNLFASGGASQ